MLGIEVKLENKRIRNGYFFLRGCEGRGINGEVIYVQDLKLIFAFPPLFLNDFFVLCSG